jgi:hypothetical protein
MRHDIGQNGHSDSDRLAMLETRAAELERMLLGMGDTDNVTAQTFADAQPGIPEFEPPAADELPTDDRTEDLVAWGRRGTRSVPRGATRPMNTRALNARTRSGGRSGSTRSKRMRTVSASPPPRRRSFLRAHWRGALTAGTVFAVAAGVTTAVLTKSGPDWPTSVAVVQSEITTACQNPDIPSEPSGVNFACSRDTEQILWVFALLTSGDNPSYINQTTTARGLEPIQPTQGGDIAWSLNLHHPYNPLSPVDSLTVAARAINNIIAGATLTSANGAPQVQPGLESSAANCKVYTGSAALSTRSGYPAVCAHPITTAAGEQALVTDVFREWMPSASAATATDAGILYANAHDPGNPQVQAILAKLPGFGL